MKLTERIKRRASEVALPAVPEDTARSKVVRDAFNFGAQVESLAAENDELRATVERMEREIERLCSKGDYVTSERNYWRKQCSLYTEANGKLAATIDGMLAMAKNAEGTVTEARMLAEQMAVPTNGVDTASHAPVLSEAPEPTLDELRPETFQ